MCWRVICWHYAWCKLYLKLLESNIYMHMCTWMCFKSTIILIAIETLTLGHPKLFIWKKSSSNRRDSMRPKQTCPPSVKGLFDPQKAPRPFFTMPTLISAQALETSDFWIAFQRSHSVLITVCCVTKRLLAITILQFGFFWIWFKWATMS